MAFRLVTLDRFHYIFKPSQDNDNHDNNKKLKFDILGMSTFYTELMRGLGASSRLWELIDRKPLISTEGKMLLLQFKCIAILF